MMAIYLYIIHFPQGKYVMGKSGSLCGLASGEEVCGECLTGVDIRRVAVHVN